MNTPFDPPDMSTAERVRRAYSGALAPDRMAQTLRQGDRLFATRRVSAGLVASVLPQRSVDFDKLRFTSGGRIVDLYDYLSANRVAGLMIIQDGAVALETYQLGNHVETRWLSMSMAKSVSTTLVGVAVQDGLIGSLDENVADYVVPLRGSAYDGVPIRDVLQMTSGVAFHEDYGDPASDRRRMLEAQIDQVPGAILAHLAEMPKAGPPGSIFNYSTGETHVVGALVQAATGRFLSDYLAEKIWRPCGMEQDAAWWLEAPGELEVAGSGLHACLRDFARFGLFMLDDGVVQGRRVLPEGWVDEATKPRQLAGQRLDYGYMWWPQPGSDGAFTDRAYRAGGIFGQYIYVNPARRLVVAVNSARSKPKGAEAIPDLDFFNAVAAAFAKDDR
ncbi:serine hydrolase domain-containing protein [Niveispirillum sp. KHB5.9]|uniref:serine hydrolase domain-containing protein n=1 Tax=Niveispirillum sp. KHB5.9 TaxID=3400269 RepID=UPI003A83E0ED